LELIRSYDIPFCLVPGNHDFLVLKREDFRSAGVQVPPYAISANGYRLIFLDANYRSDMRHFDVAGEEWTDANLPKEQCRFLENELNAATEPCIVCIHENLDPFVEKDYIVKNADEIREIIKGKATMVLQGHYHEGAERVIDGIPYVTFCAMCEGKDNAYRIIELPLKT
jgi:3',5'-cyclic AMP phosphodiesterase CpdA